MSQNRFPVMLLLFPFFCVVSKADGSIISIDLLKGQFDISEAAVAQEVEQVVHRLRGLLIDPHFQLCPSVHS